VPERLAYELSTYVEPTETPGAETKTFGEPKFENVAALSLASVAATPTAPGQAAG
jgi:hypothetical protein